MPMLNRHVRLALFICPAYRVPKDICLGKKFITFTSRSWLSKSYSGPDYNQFLPSITCASELARNFQLHLRFSRKQLPILSESHYGMICAGPHFRELHTTIPRKSIEILKYSPGFVLLAGIPLENQPDACFRDHLLQSTETLAIVQEMVGISNSVRRWIWMVR